jgi:O-antigen biosynthesis protein WbqP
MLYNLDGTFYMLTKKQQHYLILKRIIDIFGALLGITLLSPLLLLCAILTRLTSKGPALLKQLRIGIHQKPFYMYKFRSMKISAPIVGSEYLTPAQQEAMMTKWGKIMRKTSWDELPQLFNILKGEMSFIGPRPGFSVDIEPELVHARLSYVPNAYDVKPGLSGYSQMVMKRNPDFTLKAKNDSYYVAHISLKMDAKVFFLSFLTLFGYNKGH